jgi:hypothetical protein
VGFVLTTREFCVQVGAFHGLALVLDPIHGYLLELLEVVLGSNKPASQLSDVLGHFVVRVDVIRRTRTALPEGDGLELRRMLEQDGPFVGIQRVAEASRRALVGTLLLRQQAGEDRMGVGDRHGEGKQPLSATCWSWSSR